MYEHLLLTRFNKIKLLILNLGTQLYLLVNQISIEQDVIASGGTGAYHTENMSDQQLCNRSRAEQKHCSFNSSGLSPGRIDRVLGTSNFLWKVKSTDTYRNCTRHNTILQDQYDTTA